ncbi:MAG: phosphotransferase [Eubacteriales bacterium]
MASKTVFTADDIRNMLSEYDIGEAVDFSPVPRGSVQTNYFVNTTQGKFVLRYYENRHYEQVQFELLLLDKLKKERFPCAPYIPPRKNSLRIYQDKPYVLFRFVEGEHAIHPNERQFYNLIYLIGRLGEITRSLKLDYSDSRLSYNAFTLEKLAKEYAMKINTANACKKLEWMMQEIQSLDLPDTLKMGICHCDYYYTNILYDGDHIAALIDFDDANYTYLFFDLISVIHFFKPGFSHETWNKFDKKDPILDFAEAKKVIGIFEQKFEIPKEDKMHFYDILKLAILFDCLWYFERGCCGDFFEKRKIEAINQMGRKQFFEQLFG